VSKLFAHNMSLAIFNTLKSNPLVMAKHGVRFLKYPLTGADFRLLRMDYWVEACGVEV